ncbi:MAG: peroxide stress protein YaaA [Candidatus Paceibacterota bacterium]
MEIKILLPNSKSKASNPGKIYDLTKVNDNIRVELIKAVIEQMHIVETCLEGVKLRDQEISFNSLPAYRRYTGVVMRSIRHDELEKEAENSAFKSIIFLSPLLGFVEYNEETPNYRIDFDSKITNFNLRKHWGEYINNEIETLTEKILLINLLTEESKKMIKVRNKNIINVSLNAGGKLAGHNSKKAKGLLCRELLTSRDPIKTIKNFHINRDITATINN